MLRARNGSDWTEGKPEHVGLSNTEGKALAEWTSRRDGQLFGEPHPEGEISQVLRKLVYLAVKARGGVS